jgi:hypothetical protein
MNYCGDSIAPARGVVYGVILGLLTWGGVFLVWIICKAVHHG